MHTLNHCRVVLSLFAGSFPLYSHPLMPSPRFVTLHHKRRTSRPTTSHANTVTVSTNFYSCCATLLAHGFNFHPVQAPLGIVRLTSETTPLLSFFFPQFLFFFLWSLVLSRTHPLPLRIDHLFSRHPGSPNSVSRSNAAEQVHLLTLSVADPFAFCVVAVVHLPCFRQALALARLYS